MSDQILQCLDKAGQNTQSGKSSINKEAIANQRALSMIPKYPGGSMTNPTPIIPNIGPIVGEGTFIQPPISNIKGDDIKLKGEDIIRLKDQLLTANGIKDLFGKSGDVKLLTKYLKELLRTDPVHHARIAKMLKGVIGNISMKSFVFAALDTDLTNYLIENSGKAIDGIKIINNLEMNQDTRDKILKDLHEHYGDKSLWEALHEDAKNGPYLWAKAGAQIVNNIFTGTVGNMVEVFQGGDPISRMEGEFEAIRQSILSYLKN